MTADHPAKPGVTHPSQQEVETRLQEIRERHAKATSGPWMYEPDMEGDSMGWIVCPDDDCPPHGTELFEVRGDSAQQAHNAEFGAHAWDDIRFLISLLRDDGEGDSSGRAPRGEWQPIENAPKDGSRIVALGMAYPELVEGNGRWFTAKLGRARVPFVMVVHWVECWYDKEIEIGDGTYRKERTQGYAHWSPEPLAFSPTHWQPLPNPPSPLRSSGPHLPQHTEGRTSSGDGEV